MTQPTETAVEQVKEEYSVIGTKVRTLSLTENEANFLNSKGTVFVEVWSRRLAKGMKPTLQSQFDQMVQEFSTKTV